MTEDERLVQMSDSIIVMIYQDTNSKLFVKKTMEAFQSSAELNTSVLFTFLSLKIKPAA